MRDKTGLTGRYDFDMKMDLQMVLALAKRMGANIPAAAANIPQADGSSLTTALNEQLGLKLESMRAPSTSSSSIVSRHRSPTRRSVRLQADQPSLCCRPLGGLSVWRKI